MLGEAITKEQVFQTSLSGDRCLRSAVSHEAQAVATVVLGASNDPVARWFYPRSSDYIRWFPAFVRAFAGASISEGSAYCTSNYSGVALWLAPGVKPDDTAMITIIRRSIPEDRHAEVFELFRKMGEGQPSVPHWYLPMIAVDSMQQKQGIGGGLMRQSLKRCDLEGLPAYIESTNPQNISFYRRFGFEEVGEITAGGSPPLTQMLREARP